MYGSKMSVQTEDQPRQLNKLYGSCPQILEHSNFEQGAQLRWRGGGKGHAQQKYMRASKQQVRMDHKPCQAEAWHACSKILSNLALNRLARGILTHSSQIPICISKFYCKGQCVCKMCHCDFVNPSQELICYRAAIKEHVDSIRAATPGVGVGIW